MRHLLQLVTYYRLCQQITASAIWIFCSFDCNSIEESKRKMQTERDGRGSWAQRPRYSHFLLISLPQHLRCLPYPERLHPLTGSFPTGRETCYCATTLRPNSTWLLWICVCLRRANIDREADSNVDVTSKFLLELALWPPTAKQTDVSWFAEEEIKQTCWRRQKLVTNIDLRTQQLHVGATESLNTASDQMRRSRGTRVGERWLSRKTLWLNSFCNDEKSADWQIRTCSESLSSVFVRSAVNWFCSTTGHTDSLL